MEFIQLILNSITSFFSDIGSYPPAVVAFFTAISVIIINTKLSGRSKSKKSKMVLCLLKDELEKRWQSNIYKDIKNNLFCPKERGEYIQAVSIREKDLFVLFNIANNLCEDIHSQDHRFLSEVIYWYVLFTDFLDQRATIVDLMKNKDIPSDSVRLEGYWDNIVMQAKKLDKQIQKILDSIK